jgi:hypothetical protein
MPLSAFSTLSSLFFFFLIKEIERDRGRCKGGIAGFLTCGKMGVTCGKTPYTCGCSSVQNQRLSEFSTAIHRFFGLPPYPPS